jgi:PAS domain S-box-containing protein
MSTPKRQKSSFDSRRSSRNRKHIEIGALLEAQNRALEMLAEGRDLAEVLNEVLKAVERISQNGMLTSILLISPDGKRLTHCAAPSLPPEYSLAIDGSEIGPAAGSCGTSAFLGKPVIVDDLASDPRWIDYRNLALRFGLRACWSTPLLAADGRVLGTFAMYYRQPRRPSALDSQIVTTVTRTAVVAIERVQRIDRLRHREELFRALNTCSPVGVGMVDLAANCIYTNATCRKICGFSDQEAEGTGWTRFLHPDDAERVLNQWKNAFAAGRGCETECRWVHADGEIKWTVVRTDAVRSESGTLLGYMASVADRTERMMAEQKAALLSRELEAIVTASPVGIVSFAFDRTVRAWNPMAERILGWSASEIVGKQLPIPEPFKEQWRHLREVLLRNRSFTNVASRCRHKNGHELDVLLSGSPILDDTGALRGFVGSIADATELISARTQLEQTVVDLQESEARFRTLADSIDQFAWMADGKGWIFWYNQRWFDYTGSTFTDMEGWGWKKVHHPDHVERVVKRIQQSWDAGTPWEDTFPLRGKDGRYRWFLSRAVPIRDESGSVVRWFGTNTDITDRINAEEALRRSEKLNVAGKMASSVAHELNNPLATVVNLVYLAKEQATDILLLKYLSLAENELQRVSRLANRILSFQRGSTVREEFSLFELLQETALLFEPKCRQQEITLSVDARCTAVINGSKNELRQALSNLISNSVDAVGRQGRVRIRMKPGRHNQESGKAVRITVADSGKGIPERDHQNLFEPFYTTKASTGTGLGLWITKDIIQNHEGTIRLKSRCEGRHAGTIVSVGLPALRLSSFPRKFPPQSANSPARTRMQTAGVQSC